MVRFHQRFSRRIYSLGRPTHFFRRRKSIFKTFSYNNASTKDYYDVYLNEGWLDPDGDYSEYVAYRQIIGNFGEIRKRLKAEGYSETVIHALGAECDKKLSAPVVEIVRQEIEPALAGKVINLDSEEDINRLIESMTPNIGWDRLEYDFNKGFEFNNKE